MNDPNNPLTPYWQRPRRRRKGSSRQYQLAQLAQVFAMAIVRQQQPQLPAPPSAPPDPGSALALRAMEKHLRAIERYTSRTARILFWTSSLGKGILMLLFCGALAALYHWGILGGGAPVSPPSVPLPPSERSILEEITANTIAGRAEELTARLHELRAGTDEARKRLGALEASGRNSVYTARARQRISQLPTATGIVTAHRNLVAASKGGGDVRTRETTVRAVEAELVAAERCLRLALMDIQREEAGR